MKEHPDSSLISRCAMGEASDGDRAHLAVCAECRCEADRFAQSLDLFRGSVRHWSAGQITSRAPARSAHVGRPAASLVWASVTLALICFLNLKWSLTPRPAPQTVASLDGDSELMNQVRVDLERSVPRGMEPLIAEPLP
jgi:hypothetical protein